MNGVLAPEQELKSISLVKNTIRLGDSPSKFEIIETEIGKGGPKYDFDRLSSVRSGFAPIISTQSVSSQKTVDPAKEKQLKRDLDEAFKDLMSVSATLREMGKSTETTSDRRRNSSQNVIKQHNTFPSIRTHSSAAHSISTIASNNWSSYSSSTQRHNSQAYESLSDFGCEISSNKGSTTTKTKPIPKPRHFIGTTSPSPEKVIHAPLTHQQLETPTGEDTVDDLLEIRHKNVVKTIQMQFEALTHQKTVIPGE